MLTDKELVEAQVRHLKAVLKLKETHILTLKEYIRTLKRKEIKRRQREKKRDAEKKEVKKAEKTLIYDNMVEKTLIYDNMVGDINDLCATCQRYLITL